MSSGRLASGCTTGVLASIDVIADQLDPRRPAVARARALSAFSTTVGALQLSRALTDPALPNEVLERGIDRYWRNSG